MKRSVPAAEFFGTKYGKAPIARAARTLPGERKTSVSDPTKIAARFEQERAALQKLLEQNGDLTLRRFLALDRNAYEAGHLDAPTKELLGLVASLVLRCDDCVRYHLGRAAAAGFTDEQIREALSVAAVVGGTIVVPHLRRAYEYWEALRRRRPTPTEKRAEILAALRETLKEVRRLAGRAATAARLLYEGDRRFFWIGFYLKEPGEDVLEVGPYQGPPPCVRIPFTKGVCGEVARTRRARVVPDVRRLPHYVACHAEPRSEVVVPLLCRPSGGADGKGRQGGWDGEDGKGELLGVLDGDSVKEAAFDKADVAWLAEIAALVVAAV